MYTIKAYVDSKEYTIHDARVKALTVGGNPYFEIGDNINGSATFKVFPTHPYYDKVTKLTTDIVIYRDDEPEFYGRVLYDDEDFSGTKKVFVEGELAFLCDSIQRPKVYHNISVKAYVQDLIDIHNAQVEERKQFVVGRVTVKDSNDSLYRYGKELRKLNTPLMVKKGKYVTLPRYHAGASFFIAEQVCRINQYTKFTKIPLQI